MFWGLTIKTDLTIELFVFLMLNIQYTHTFTRDEIV